MEALQEVFNNREIALGCWIIISIIFGLFTKAGREFFKSVVIIVFSRKMIFLYTIYLSFFSLTVFYLYHAGFWDWLLLKDTVFWGMFVFIPLFSKTIMQAKDARYFIKLIKDNFRLIVVIEFILNFWTFNLAIEILIVPIAFLLGGVYAVASRDERTAVVNKLINQLYFLFGIILIIYAFYHLIKNTGELFNIDSLKEFLIPFLLLLMNLPVVYVVALFNNYEQLFIRLNGDPKEQRKMRMLLIRFLGINLKKISSLNNYLIRAIRLRTSDELKQNLHKFSEYLETRVGDNYMNRSRYYILSFIFIITICLSGIILSNSTVGLKDLLTFNFVVNIAKVREITTYILSTALAISVCFLVYFIGFGKRKYEEFSQVKKIALHDLFFLIKQQNRLLLDSPPVKDPLNLFVRYVTNIYEIKRECDKAISNYENLMTSWELEVLKKLQTCTAILISTIGIEDIDGYSAEEFVNFYNSKKASAPQNEKINVFIYDIEKDLVKYSEQIKLCMEVFQNCI